MPRRLVSETGLQLVMSFEGYRRSSAVLADGRWTIGYGHTKSARRGASVSEADARALLVYDMMEVAELLEAVVFTPLNQNQFDALASFAFNIGLDNFRHSTVLQRVNQGVLLHAAYAIEQWRKADLDGEAIVVDGLVRRRAMEKTLFLTPPDGWIPIPTPVAPPRFDHSLINFETTAQPVQLRANLTGDVAKAERVREVEPLIVLSPAPLLNPLAEAEPVAPFPATGPEPQTEPVFDGSVEGPVIDEDDWIIESPAPVSPPTAPQPALQASPPPQAPATSPPLEPAPLDLDMPLPTGQPSAIRAKFRDFEFSTVDPKPPAYGPWLAVGVFGLIVFVGALFWAISAHGPAGPFSPQVIGVLLALAGVACVVCAVYSLIQQFLGRED
jgi:lysozyme